MSALGKDTSMLKLDFEQSKSKSLEEIEYLT